MSTTSASPSALLLSIILSIVAVITDGFEASAMLFATSFVYDSVPFFSTVGSPSPVPLILAMILAFRCSVVLVFRVLTFGLTELQD
jgi:hypothetical protein